MDEPQGSRLFVVCGKAAEMSDLENVFNQYGPVQYVKMVREKGVAYVKFDRASTAAQAMEDLNGIVLNDGRGPQLKVLLAESPNTNSPRQQSSPDDVYQDPVNHPPRSRLFLVVPRTADEQLLQQEMGKYDGLEYCKTDLIASKGIAFAKYSKASQALIALEDINKTNMLAGYRIKCMLAEPKVRQGASQPQSNMAPFGLQNDQLFLPNMDTTGAAIDQLLQSGSLGGFSSQGTQQLSGFLNDNDWNLAAQLGNINNIMDMSQHQQQPLDGFGNIQNLAGQLSSLSLGSNQGVQGGGMTPPLSPMTPINFQFRTNAVQESPMSPRPTGQRLFVVVHKGATEEQLARCFRRFPGMEYCDLKRDRITGKSKGYAYVNYSTPDAAQAAIDQLNGIEFPQGSCQQLKVMLADPLVPRNLNSARWPEDEAVGGANLEMGGLDVVPNMYDPRVVHFYLERPLPDYALKNVFDEHCHVENVQLHSDDPRLGYAVAMTPEDAQRLAVTLNGQNIVGVPVSMYLNTFDPNGGGGGRSVTDNASAQPMGSGDMLGFADFAQQLLPESHHLN